MLDHVTNLPIVPLNAILAMERRPPKGQPAILWVLLTNMPVTGVKQAMEKVRWYTQRWNIELFHKVLKSGCGVENAQLRHADRLKSYVTVKSIVAWRLFWLSRLQQHTPETPCDIVLAAHEWSMLYRKVKKTRFIPDTPPSIADAVVCAHSGHSDHPFWFYSITGAA